MSNKKAAFTLVVLAVFVAAGATLILWPKTYTVGQRMTQTTVFWNDHEAFLFLTFNTTGRAQNVFQQKLEHSRYAYLSLLTGGLTSFMKQNTDAYHLSATGVLDKFQLPENTVTYGNWELANGRLQLTAPPSVTPNQAGTRWDGSRFVPVPAAPWQPQQTAEPASGKSTLTADDEAEDDSADEDAFLSKASRQAFKNAGWHYKVLSGYESNGGQATLPIVLSGNVFNLTVETAQDSEGDRFDFLTFGSRSLTLSGDKLTTGTTVLWNQKGWQSVSKAEFDPLMARYGHANRRIPFNTRSTIWLATVLVLLGLRFGGWFHMLFSFATMKRRVLKNMATSYSFPPVSPAQFPALDLEALDRYTRAFEGMGFTRLLDCSMVSDSATNSPSFLRLFAHTRYHCFGEVSQLFPKGKKHMLLKCSIQSTLQNGWTISYSDRKPQAASLLLRRRKAIGICMPELNPSELLQAFLKMRDQVCLDLGIQTINDDTLEAYVAKANRQLSEMRVAVQSKNFAKGVPEVYLRKLSLLKTKPEYVWLGDYPREAEQRKQGFSSFAAGAR